MLVNENHAWLVVGGGGGHLLRIVVWVDPFYMHFYSGVKPFISSRDPMYLYFLGKNAFSSLVFSDFLKFSLETQILAKMVPKTLVSSPKLFLEILLVKIWGTQKIIWVSPRFMVVYASDRNHHTGERNHQCF